MMSGELILARHGQIEQVEPRRFVGQRDVALDDVGRAQARGMGRWLLDRSDDGPLDRVVASDLSRCVDTARIALEAAGWADMPIDTEPALREVGLGAWEGLTTDEVRERFGEEYAARGNDIGGVRPTGGECFADVERRVWPALCGLVEELRSGAARRILVVAHGGVNRTLLCRVLNVPLNHLFQFGQDYACVNILRLDERCALRCAVVNHAVHAFTEPRRSSS